MIDFEKTKQLAEQGDADAQYYLGWQYEYGQGVKEDYAEAVRWYTKAAEQGLDVAQDLLDIKQKTGQGLK